MVAHLFPVCIPRRPLALEIGKTAAAFLHKVAVVLLGFPVLHRLAFLD
jgi:hypothetical protein